MISNPCYCIYLDFPHNIWKMTPFKKENCSYFHFPPAIAVQVIPLHAGPLF